MMGASQLPIAAYGNIESLGAAAYAQGRACVPLLKGQIVPALSPRERFTPERIVHHIERQNLLDERTATELEILVVMISRLIAVGTVETVRWTDEDEGHVGEPRSWIERRLSPEAARLAAALAEIETLLALVRGVLDLVAAQGAIQAIMQKER